MPGSMSGAVRFVDRAAGERWRSADPLLPAPDDLAEGCAPPFTVTGQDGLPAGYAVCRHRYLPDTSLEQTWGARTRYVLTPRLAGQDTYAALDSLLTQWRDHLAGIPAVAGDDTAALLIWPARDTTGVRALLKHGLQPMSVIAARTRPPQRTAMVPSRSFEVRTATERDVEIVTELELGVMAYDAQFGGAIKRPATADLVRGDVKVHLARNPAWTWLAEAEAKPIGLLTIQPPDLARWIAGYTSLAPAAYLSTMFVEPGYRAKGVGAALVGHAHEKLDSEGVAVTLLHHAQVNPLSGPFWNRMGYRPLWTTWETRPAVTLR
jgi:GNAT superfamily N-acetyltransferase